LAHLVCASLADQGDQGVDIRLGASRTDNTRARLDAWRIAAASRTSRSPASTGTDSAQIGKLAEWVDGASVVVTALAGNSHQNVIPRPDRRPSAV
jgi:hypothetical protein